MKAKLFISIPILFVGLFVMGQSSTVYTPWGTAVSVTTQNDMSPESRDQWDAAHSSYENNGAIFHSTLYGDSQYPWPSSTSKFNCHGYAWYMFWRGPSQEFNAPWNMTDTEAEKYFDDPSYVETTTKADADIWWINNGSHSAIATDVTDYLKSKWGTGPLATHHKDNQPYTIYSVKYYKVCLYETSGTISSDITLDHCAIKFNSTSVSSYVDLEVEYEKGVLLEGPFSTGTGATLYFHPD